MAAAPAAHGPCGHGGWARSVRTRGARGTTGLVNHGHEGHMNERLMYLFFGAFVLSTGVTVRLIRLCVALAH